MAKLKITESTSSYLSQLTVTTLGVEGNPIGNIGVRRFLPSLSQLQFLDIRQTGITVEGLEPLLGLKWMTALHAINLSHIVGILCKLTTLRELKLKQSLVTSEGLCQLLRSLTRLSSLDLAQNHISDEGLIYLSYLSHLTYLSLEKNGITCTGVGNSLCLLTNLRSLNHNGNVIEAQGVVTKLINLNITEVGIPQFCYRAAVVGYLTHLKRLQRINGHMICDT